MSKLRKALLARFQDDEEAGDLDAAFFAAPNTNQGGHEGPATLRGASEYFSLDDNFETLKIQGEDLATLRAQQGAATGLQEPREPREPREPPESREPRLRGSFHLNRSLTPTLRPREDLVSPQRVNYREEEHDAFLDGFDGLSPETLSTSSPKPRMKGKLLSEYSEENEADDTDVTSEFDVADMAGVDDIFGCEESGVYSSGGFKKSPGGRPHKSRAKTMLELKQQELLARAELEEQEMIQRYGAKLEAHGGKTNTLKLKDFNCAIEKDALENEKTINYEYTRDDYDDFEEGFELSTPLRLAARGGQRVVSNKLSMPQIDAKAPAPMKRYRSMMNVKADEGESQRVKDNLMRKLNRIPSFHNPQRLASKGLAIGLDHIEELQPHNETYTRKMDMEMEYKKQQLLEKYMEITNHQRRHRATHGAHTRSQVRKRPGSTLGLVRYLNDQSMPPHMGGPKPSPMHYNPSEHRWEGNDIDLYKFESIRALPAARPKFIPHRSLVAHDDATDAKVVGNMRYDPLAMRWVKVNSYEDEEEEEDVFDDLPDLPEPPRRLTKTALAAVAHSKSQQNLQKRASTNFRKSTSTNTIKSLLKLGYPRYAKPPVDHNRGVSTTSLFTQRTSSTSTSSLNEDVVDDTLIQQQFIMPELFLDDRLIERFAKEEAKWLKKTKNWFDEGERFNFEDDPTRISKDYYWEIRKMVCEDES